MNESLMALAEGQAGGDYEALSEQMELESQRYSRSAQNITFMLIVTLNGLSCQPLI